MANSDKVRKSFSLARIVKNLDDVTFDVLQQSGFFVTLKGNRIIETDNLQDAHSLVSSMNIVIQPIVNNFKNDYENRIGQILA